MNVFLAVLMILGDFGRTSSLIDIPYPPQYKPGMYGLVLVPSFSLRDNSHPNEFDVNFRYGISPKLELAASAYTPTSYAASLSYMLTSGKKSTGGFYCGVDDITYTKEVSSTGGNGTGFTDDSMYVVYGGRNPEVFSVYFAGFKKVPPLDLIAGLGRGRFVGYGPNSRYFNTDYYLRDIGPDTSKGPAVYAIGLFLGIAANLTPSLALLGELDGRDVNVGMRYHSKVVAVSAAASKIEQLGKDELYSARFSMAVEVNNNFMKEGASKNGTLGCAVVDGQTKAPLGDVVVSISETGKRFRSVKNYFELTVPKGRYTLKVEKKDYNPQTMVVQVKPGLTTKVEFTMSKSAAAIRVDVDKVARQEQIQKLLKAGLDQVSRDSLLAARGTFENILRIDSTHAQAKSYLNFVRTRIQDAIAMYMRQAETYARQGNKAQAISSYQKVLGLDPGNVTATQELAKLTTATAVVKKPTPVVKKPTPVVKKPTPASAQEIEDLYKRGISLFAKEKYDEALKVFKKILALNPNHVGAKNYLKKTEARLKALRGG